jgi:EAL domain-containing protein (putative c-di-GMP-specific phosphodiesterase class I)
VAINLAAKDLLQADLAQRLVDKVESQQLGPDDISFEITEGDMVRDTQAAVAQLTMLQNKGYTTAIDDFGTGYSSMAYLKDFPVSALKIDKAFVLALAEDKSDQNIVKAVLELAHGFGLSVIAEGVEDKASLQWLAQLGCDYAQGYFIERPLPLTDFLAWLESNNNTQWLH